MTNWATQHQKMKTIETRFEICAVNPDLVALYIIL